MEKILSINSGSSSLKFKLFAMPDEKVLAKGLFDRIGIDNSRVTIKYDGKKYDEQRELKDHNQAVHVLLSLFKELIQKKRLQTHQQQRPAGRLFVRRKLFLILLFTQF